VPLRDRAYLVADSAVPEGNPRDPQDAATL
jgi:hypothetical protein